MDHALHQAVSTLLRDVAERFIMPRWQQLSRDDIQEKAPGDLVTIADRESEAMLAHGLTALLPGVRVVGEEAASDDPALLDDLGAGALWLVDPLDGTGNFVSGSPHFAVMLALVRDGITEAGWIYQPAHQALYRAQKGAGAWCNDKPVTVQPAAGRGLTGAFPTRYASAQQQETIDRFKAKAAHALPGLLCAGVDYTRCIDGTQDFALFWRSMPWDHAPGSLILAEAGGWAGWHDGTPYAVTDRRPGLIAKGVRAKDVSA